MTIFIVIVPCYGNLSNNRCCFILFYAGEGTSALSLSDRATIMYLLLQPWASFPWIMSLCNIWNWSADIQSMAKDYSFESIPSYLIFFLFCSHAFFFISFNYFLVLLFNFFGLQEILTFEILGFIFLIYYGTKS